MHRFVAIVPCFMLLVPHAVLSADKNSKLSKKKSHAPQVLVKGVPFTSSQQGNPEDHEKGAEKKSDEHQLPQPSAASALTLHEPTATPSSLPPFPLHRNVSNGSDSLGRSISPTPSLQSGQRKAHKQLPRNKPHSSKKHDAEQKVNYSEAARLEQGMLSSVWSFFEGSVRARRTTVFNQIQNQTFLEQHQADYRRSFLINTALAEFTMTRINRPHDGLLCRALKTIQYANEHDIQIADKNIQEVLLMLQERMKKDAESLKLLQRLTHHKKPASKQSISRPIIPDEEGSGLSGSEDDEDYSSARRNSGSADGDDASQ